MVVFIMVCNSGVCAGSIKMQNINGKNEAPVKRGRMALSNLGIAGITVRIISSLQAES